LKLKLNNFKRFSSLEIELDQPLTVLVGRNNSGKSTILEAIRVAFEDLRSDFYLNKKLGKTGTAESILTCMLSEDEWDNAIKLVRDQFPEDVDRGEVIALLGDTPIEIRKLIQYVNGNITNNYREVKLFSEKILSQINPRAHQAIRSAVHNLRGQNLAIFAGMMYLSAERVMDSQENFVPFNNLAQHSERHRLVRNNLYFLKKQRQEKYEEIIKKITRIFPDIQNIEAILNEFTGRIDLDLQEGSYKSDIGELGSGTKALVMIMGRILSPGTTIALLDEPDVNMHSGLVQELARALEEVSKETQIIISSHHEAFVNRIDRSNIIHVKRKDVLESTASLLTDRQQITEILEDIGIPLSNYSVAEAITSKVIVIGEGDSDWTYLTSLARKAEKYEELMSVAPVYHALGGKGRTVDAKLLDRIYNSPAPFVFIRDRDETKAKRMADIETKLGRNRVHFLTRREIENYCLDYEAILQLLKDKSVTKSQEIQNKVDAVTIETLKEKVKELANSLKMKVVILRFIENLPVLRFLEGDEISKFVEDNMVTTLDEARNIIIDFKSNVLDKLSELKSDDLVSVLKEQYSELDNLWQGDQILSLCPGKDLIKLINNWATENFGINVTALLLIERLKRVDPEIVQLIEKIIDASKATPLPESATSSG
jgi:predicted ATP-dependent endonuclease of OLD family